MPESTVINPPGTKSPETTPALEIRPAVAPQEPDLITKVTQFKKPEPTKIQEGIDIGFDFKELENIKDPVAKEIALKAYKSMQSGVTKKFQEVAEIKRNAEQKLQEISTWTPERLQQELKNPDFLRVAQQITETLNQNPKGLTDDELSVLTSEEKAELTLLKNDINLLKQSNFSSLMAQQDAHLSSKYADYNPTHINSIINEMNSGKIIATREHIYKAFLHDEHVKAAYELGKQETAQLKQEKINAISTGGFQAVNSSDIPQKNKGERDESYFLRLAQGRLAQFRK